MATSLSPRHLMAALVAGLALSLSPTVSAQADEAPVVRAPRATIAAPRVRPAARAGYAPVHHAYACGGCGPGFVSYEPRYYASRYYGCGCGLPVAVPYYWAVRWARYHYAYQHHRFYE